MKKILKIMEKVLLALVIVLVSSLLVIFAYNRIKMKKEEPLLLICRSALTVLAETGLFLFSNLPIFPEWHPS